MDTQANTQNSNVMLNALNWAYDKAVTGGIGLSSAEEMASDYLQGTGTLDEKIESMVRTQSFKSLGTGFVTGLGGFTTLAVTIPADMASGFVIQSRMIAAVASMRGYDVHDDRVRTLCFLCMVCNSVKDIASEIGTQALCKLLTKAIAKIPKELIAKINKKVGFKLLTRFGSKGVIKLGKLVPFFGGALNAGIDFACTKRVGKIAMEVFA